MRIRTRARARASLVAALMIAGVALGVGVAPAQETMSETPPFADPPAGLGTCEVVTFPVTLPGGAAAALVGHLCEPRVVTRHGQLQVLLHGGTYNASYWSWPQDPARHSYVWLALAEGWPVLALDRLGYGRSTRPPSTADTFAAQAGTLHQVFVTLRGRGWRTLVGVGHSFGSAELDNEAATYPRDLDALVLTGSGARTSAETTRQSRELVAANTLPPRRFRGLDAGYLTSPTVAAREALLYDAMDVRPDVVRYDYATEDTLPLGEVTSRPASLTALTDTLRVPVLLLDGQRDSHYCDGAQAAPETGLDDCATGATLYASEAANYPNACLAAAVVPGSGHDLTTEDGAVEAAATALGWLAATVTREGVRCAERGAA